MNIFEKRQIEERARLSEERAKRIKALIASVVKESEAMYAHNTLSGLQTNARSER